MIVRVPSRTASRAVRRTMPRPAPPHADRHRGRLGELERHPRAVRDRAQLEAGEHGRRAVEIGGLPRRGRQPVIDGARCGLRRRRRGGRRRRGVARRRGGRRRGRGRRRGGRARRRGRRLRRAGDGDRPGHRLGCVPRTRTCRCPARRTCACSSRTGRRRSGRRTNPCRRQARRRAFRLWVAPLHCQVIDSPVSIDAVFGSQVLAWPVKTASARGSVAPATLTTATADMTARTAAAARRPPRRRPLS